MTDEAAGDAGAILDLDRVRAPLRTIAFGRGIHYARATSSTMDDARRLAGSGCPHGMVAVADEQTSGRGTKGQRARAGSGVRPAFEGGQMPLYRRIARRGFSNHPFRTVYRTVDVRALNRFADGDTVDRQALFDAGVIGSAGAPVKLLGSGSLERALTVRLDRASAGALRKVAAAGGTFAAIGDPVGADAAAEDAATGDGQD